MSDMITRHEQLVKAIPSLRDSARLEQIHKGYSQDCKYLVYDRNDHPLFILRTYPVEQHESKHQEFSRLHTMEALDVKCSRPIAFGLLPDEALGYMLVSYIGGNEATEALPELTEEAQFSIGMEAGVELKKMHQVQGPANLPSWEESMRAKHQRYRLAYAACGVTIHNEEQLLSFIDDHLILMKDRPNLFQHDDYHIGNLIVQEGKLSGIIDFNRYDWGDPIHEFVKVGIFSAEVSVPFSIGQIRGYHDGGEPDDGFWRLYSLYLAMTLISSVVWILKVRPDELDEMMGKIDKVMDDHDNFSLIVPKWYVKK